MNKIRAAINATSVLTTVLAFVLALLVGAILIAVGSKEVTDAARYFFARPQDTLSLAFTTITKAYWALITGSLVNPQAATVMGVLHPLTETLTMAAPLAVAGLAVGIAFKGGLFNIGAEGQLIVGAIAAAYVGFAWHLPPGIHLLVALLAAMAAGAVWAGIAGALKAKTGAHEVITTIMLNYVAQYLLLFLLTLSAFQRPGRSDPISPVVDRSAQLPLMLGDASRLHAGLLVAIGGIAATWWFMNRSVWGLPIKAVGANPHAAQTTGIPVAGTTMMMMAVAGAFAGLGGAFQVLGTEKSLGTGISGGLGFDAITVALLGRGNPWGIAASAFLFGGLRAGGVAMQAKTGTSIDLVVVLQALVVLFTAAPPLVRTIFRLPAAKGAGFGVPLSKGWGA